MFGLGVFLVALADRLARRKHDNDRKCDICKQGFATFEEVEVHRREAHSDAVPA